MHGRGDHGQGPETLTDPNAQHVQLEKCVVDGLATVHVHEEVVEKAAAPRSHRAYDVTPGQETIIVPHQFGGHRCQNIYNGDTWGREGVLILTRIKRKLNLNVVKLARV